jgi:hypothetical protein
MRHAANVAKLAELFRAAQVLAYNERVDRLNAIRLLQALVAAGANCDTPMADAWIRKIALEIGLEDQELYSALTYAGAQNWIANNQKEGWTSLTRTGEAWASHVSTTKRELRRRRRHTK